MRNFGLFLPLLIVLPTVFVTIDSRFSAIGVIALIMGFLTIIVLGLRSSFTQHRHGIFAQWSAPKEFVKMKLSEMEHKILRVALGLVVGGLIAIVVQIAQ